MAWLRVRMHCIRSGNLGEAICSFASPRSKIHCPLPYGPAERAQAGTQRLRKFHTEGHRNGAQSLPIVMIFHVSRHHHGLCRGTVALAHLQPMHRCSREPWATFCQANLFAITATQQLPTSVKGHQTVLGWMQRTALPAHMPTGKNHEKMTLQTKRVKRCSKGWPSSNSAERFPKNGQIVCVGGGKFGCFAFSNLYWIFGLLRINYANLTGTVQGLSTLKHAQLVNLHQFLSHEKKWKSTVPQVAKHPSITYIIKQKTRVSLHSRHHNFSHT